MTDLFEIINQFDGNLLIGIQRALNADWLTPVMKFITLLCEAGVFWIAVCLLLIALKKTRRLGIICACSLAVTFICCNSILKPLVDRPRPWELFEAVNAMLPPPGDSSFPSGHSANSMGPAWAMFFATLPARVRGTDGRTRFLSYDAVPCLGWNGSGADPRMMHRLGIAAVLLAMLIGLSRLYLGMHFPTDVLLGLLLGMLCATAVCRGISAVESRRGLIGAADCNNTHDEQTDQRDGLQ